MKTFACWLGVLGVLGVASISTAHADDAATKSKKPGGCVDVHTDASFASVGFDHIVTLHSECKKHMSCTVKTDVNPEPANVELAPGADESVVTWRGSPAREFKADVTCSESKPVAN
jgi:hypothetical protein